MAIDNIPYPEATLALPSQSFYPLKIPVSHWQLRHYISHPEKDVIYYASGNEIYYLNVSTKKRKHIKTLPFEARCTASAHGYICVGGEEEGHFAIVKLGGRTADVDSALPLDYWGTHRSTPYAEDTTVERIGEEIVNSISIHKIQHEESHLYDVAAVLTNNDKTVRIYSLTQRVETEVLDFPFPMNHATISPKGNILVAVGDENRAFFFKSDLAQTPPQIPKPHNRLNMCSVTWRHVGDMDLHIPEKHDPNVHRGYFTTAWSPSGHLLALGSEAGYITVIDMLELEESNFTEPESAVVAVVASSRPNLKLYMHPGAVRSMLFSPEPWDLLIWAEDQGRICICDIRSEFHEKQVITLDPSSSTLEKLEVEETLPDSPEDTDMPDSDLLAHYENELNARDSNRGHLSALHDSSDAQTRQRARRSNRFGSRSANNRPSEFSVLDDDPQGLTASEQQILESLRTTRQRAEARAQNQGQPGRPVSINYTRPTSLYERVFGRDAAARRERNGSDSNRSTLNLWETDHTDDVAFPELSRTRLRTPSSGHGRDSDDALRPLNDINEYLSLRDREAHNDEGTQPEPNADSSRPARRSSRIQMPSNGPASTSRDINGPGLTARRTGVPFRIDPAILAMARDLPPHAQRAVMLAAAPSPRELATATAEERDAPWRTISDAMDLARGPLFDRDARTEDNAEGTEQEASSRDQNGGLRRTTRTRDVEIDDTTATNRREGTERRSTQSARAQVLRRAIDALDDNSARDRTRATQRALRGEGDNAASAPQRYELLQDATSAVRDLQASYNGLRRTRTRPVVGMSTVTGREVGVRTAGLAISRDGSTVWAATEEGIFEMKVAIKSRLVSPAVALR